MQGKELFDNFVFFFFFAIQSKIPKNLIYSNSKPHSDLNIITDAHRFITINT